VRILFTTSGHAGHLIPLLPFAHAAARAGHDVLVATQRSRMAAVERAGIAAAGFPDAPEERWHPLLARLATLPVGEADALALRDGFAGLLAPAALPDLLRLVAGWRPDLVVRESFEFAGGLAAEAHGVPLARIGLGLEQSEEWAIAHAAPAVDAQRGALGLRPDPRGDVLRGAPYLTLVPNALEVPGARQPAPVHRFRDGRTALRVADGDARPLAYVTFGSVVGNLPLFPELHRAVLGALAELPVRVLVTLGHGADSAALGPLPEHVRVESWTPQDAVLGRAAVVICHGGSGTTYGALAHGVPVVALPLFSGDQWNNARRAAATGAGIALEGAVRGAMELPGADVFGALPGAVRRVLAEPGFRRAARGLATAFAALPPVDEAPAVLEAIAGVRPQLAVRHAPMR